MLASTLYPCIDKSKIINHSISTFMGLAVLCLLSVGWNMRTQQDIPL